jgi:lipoate-protein ligase B
MFKTQFLNIEKLAYHEALILMRELADVKGRSTRPEVLIITEHEPVLTMGRRAEQSDILVPREVLDSKGIGIHRVERGGLITYHGPGQIVAYPIFHLRTMSLDVGELVYGLEQVVLNTLSDFGIAAERLKGSRGVWVKRAKIASIGVAVRRSVSFHGMALNCDPNLSHFELINPCGLNGACMTSMSRVLNEPVNSTAVRAVMALHFERQFHLELTEPFIDQDYGINPNKDVFSSYTLTAA